jgi:two-component system OmpR family response regulator
MLKIVVVDDEKSICDFVEAFFKSRGHVVITATNPLEALDIISKEQPKVIMLDIRMPQMDGLTLLAKIKQSGSKAKIIMVTVADDEQTKEKARQLGADAFISKPFSTDYLEEVVADKIEELLNDRKGVNNG